MHIVWVLSNNSSAPYFNWFAERSQQNKEVKFSFICLYPETPRMIEEMNAFGCTCYWIKYDSKHRKSGLIHSFFSVYRLLKKLKPDVVHTHLFDDSLPTLLAAKIAGVQRRVITKGDAGFHFFYQRKWVFFDMLNNRNATDIVAISEQNKKFILEKEKAKKSKTHLIHHGIPIQKSTDHKENVKAQLISTYKLDGKFIIGNVSRLIDWKGQKYIIEAATLVSKEFPDVVFLFIGNGETKPQLQKQIKDAGLDQFFRFIERVEPLEMPSAYGIMHLYVHAASYEPFGFVVAEAMVNGIPIVSTNTGSAADIILDQQNGILVAEKDSAALATGIVQSIRDYSRAKEMSQSARATAQKIFNFELMWDKHLALYKR